MLRTILGVIAQRLANALEQLWFSSTTTKLHKNTYYINATWIF